MPVRFFIDYKGFQLKNRKQTKEWIVKICKYYNRIDNDINFIFVGRNTILKLNKKYLNHNWLTDVITFPGDHNDKDEIEGEIYICTYQVKKNALFFHERFNKELKRVMAHGILHLVGFDDNTDERSQIMRTMEEKMISLW
ncbi:MAG: rRNA maturation RNase YbeY [Candidatus Methanofastidiosa archaeon]|nr:rRNA maturation RNase YbeY [Candidatus Methanofastidiosa archaeon]